MIDFSKLKVKEDTRFVGIRKNERGEWIFCTPPGFKYFPKNDYAALESLFRSVYKALSKFALDSPRARNDQKPINQTAGQKDNKGFSYESKTGEIVTYTNFSLFNNLIAAHSDLQITDLMNKELPSEQVDYSKIHKYLHNANFLPNDVIYIEEMNQPRKILELDTTLLIEMYCYIYIEIKLLLGEKVESHLTKMLSISFSEKKLHYNTHLFSNNNDNIIFLLKDILTEIDQNTVYKDSDYYHFYDAVYGFLYGDLSDKSNNNDVLWGISTFADVWEELCLAYIKPRYESEICITSGLNNKLEIGQNRYANGIKASLQEKTPDIILRKDNLQSNLGGFLIIDYKYVNFNLYLNIGVNNHKKRTDDVEKQKKYRELVKTTYPDAIIKAIFWIPKYFKEGVEKEEKNVRKELSDASIEVVSINFLYVLDLYINDK